MKFDLDLEEMECIKRRRLTKKLWDHFSPTKCHMSWYKENTPNKSSFTYEISKIYDIIQEQK